MGERHVNYDGDDDEDADQLELIRRLQSEMQRLKKKDKLQTQTMKVNSQNIELMIEHIPALKELKLLAGSPQDDDSSYNEEDDEKV